MRKLTMVLAIALIGLLPVSATAQEQAPPPPSAEMVNEIDTVRLLVIGTGILAGAFAMDALIATDLSILAGAVVGGVLTDWWYRSQQQDMLMRSKKFRSASRHPELPNLMHLASTSPN